MSGISYLQGGPTWNVVTGCTPAHTGCNSCWAKSLHDMRHAAHLRGEKMPPQYAHPFSKIQLHPDRLIDPLHWRKPRTIGVVFGGDLFHKDVPDDFIDGVFATMRDCPQHRFILPTKRPERAEQYLCRPWNLPNLMLVYSASDQATLDAGMPHLLRANVARRGLSLEPLVGEIDLDLEPYKCDCGFKGYASDLSGVIDNEDEEGWECPDCGQPALDIKRDGWVRGNGLNWVTVGCESGPKRRPMGAEWARFIIEQCRAAGVRMWMKQMEVNGKVSTDPATWPEWAKVQQPPFEESDHA